MRIANSAIWVKADRRALMAVEKAQSKCGEKLFRLRIGRPCNAGTCQNLGLGSTFQSIKLAHPLAVCV
jgi:hypothetical protein